MRIENIACLILEEGAPVFYFRPAPPEVEYAGHVSPCLAMSRHVSASAATGCK